MTASEDGSLSVDDLTRCFEGGVPAVVATAAADGTPNVTYLSRVRPVDAERIALSNQFFSKTARNLAENPRASVLLVDPTNHDQFRLSVVYERTERRGPMFDRLRDDVEALAVMQGMQGVFKLRAADIYRVLYVEQVLGAVHRRGQHLAGRAPARDAQRWATQLAQLSARLGRCTDLDALVGTTVQGLSDLLGFEHSLLLLLDEDGTHLYTIASHGFEAEGVGSEVIVGEGIIGMVAARGVPMRLGNLRQMRKYSRSVRRAYEEQGVIGAGREIPVPGLRDADSRIAVPAMSRGQLVGVLVVESEQGLAFDELDESMLSVVATLVANAIESERAQDRPEEAAARRPQPTSVTGGPTATTHVRFFPADGSTFVDGDYVIKGVAGRLLWSLLRARVEEGRTEFTNREVRLDPSLELPDLRDNFESRLILLKRRLEERNLPVRVEKCGRGRFSVVAETALRLERMGD
jgi:adenylate cyclase